MIVLNELSAKDALKRIELLEAQIHINAEEIQCLKDKAYNLKAISYDPKVGVSGNNNTRSSQEKYLPIISERIQKLYAQVDEWNKYRDTIHELLNELDSSQYKKVLYYRYFLYHSWEKIAVEMDYSYKGIHKVHGSAVKEFEKKLKEYTKVHTQP